MEFLKRWSKSYHKATLATLSPDSIPYFTEFTWCGLSLAFTAIWIILVLVYTEWTKGTFGTFYLVTSLIKVSSPGWLIASSCSCSVNHLPWWMVHCTLLKLYFYRCSWDPSSCMLITTLKVVWLDHTKETTQFWEESSLRSFSKTHNRASCFSQFQSIFQHGVLLSSC